MQLSVLLPMVIAGIAGIALLLHLFGLSRPARLADATAARAAWLREFPEASPRQITLSEDHTAALIDTPDGHGIVWIIGADTTARYLREATIAPTARGLRIHLPDYTAPRIDLTLGKGEAARRADLLGVAP